MKSSAVRRTTYDNQTNISTFVILCSCAITEIRQRHVRPIRRNQAHDSGKMTAAQLHICLSVRLLNCVASAVGQGRLRPISSSQDSSCQDVLRHRVDSELIKISAVFDCSVSAAGQIHACRKTATRRSRCENTASQTRSISLEPASCSLSPAARSFCNSSTRRFLSSIMPRISSLHCSESSMTASKTRTNSSGESP